MIDFPIKIHYINPEYIFLLSCTIIMLLIPRFRNEWFLRSAHQNKLIKQSPPERLNTVDFLRGIGMIAVIFIHVIVLIYPKHPTQWLIAANNLLRFPVGMFLIFSGALLNPFAVQGGWRSLKVFYLKKIGRIYVPYLMVCTITAVVMRISFSEFLTVLLTGRIQIPFYFFIVLAQCYLLYPLLLKIQPHSWFLPLLFFVSLFMSFIPSNPSAFPLVFPYLFYFAYGMNLRNQLLSRTIQSSWWMYAPIPIIYGFLQFFSHPYILNLNFFYTISIISILFQLCLKLPQKNSPYIFATITGKNSLWVLLLHFPLTFVVVSTILPVSLPLIIKVLIAGTVSTIVSVALSAVFDAMYQIIIKKAADLTLHIRYNTP